MTNSLLPASDDAEDADERLAEMDRDWHGVAAQTQGSPSGPVSPGLGPQSRRLLGRMLRPHRGALTLGVVVIMLQTAASLAGPYLVSIGIDSGIPALRRHDWAPVAVVTALIFLSALATGYLQRWFMILVGTAGQQALLELRREVFRKFQQLPIAFHERYQSGQVISRLTSDFDALNDMLNSSLDGLVNAALTAVAIVVVLLVLNWTLTLVLLASLPVLGWLLFWFSARSSIAYRRTRESTGIMMVQFVESMNGIRVVQAFRREERNERIFGALNGDFRQANAKAMRLLGLFMPGLLGVGGVVKAVALVFGGYLVIHGDLQIGVLAAFVLYLRQFFAPLQNLAGFANSYRSATAALEKLSGVLEEPVRVSEPAMPRELPAPARGAVEFDAVTFSYPRRLQETSGVAERDSPGLSHAFALTDLSLRIPAGQTVAIVGATGAGKTTLVRLLCRFYDPAQGSVRIDGVNVRDVTDAELRRAVVMVTQENFMFSGTVLDNILFGKPDATRAQAEDAAAAVGAGEFIRALPDGFDTSVGKRGARLSAGQRQLIAFSRAFLADPAVLVLDEATSLLDMPSERGVQQALRTVLAERTALIIAHRLSTVEIADRVLVMEDGRIVEDGSPATLIRQGKFAELHATWRARSG